MQVKLKTCVNCALPKVIWKNHEGKRYCKICWLSITKAIVKPTIKQKKIPSRSSKKIKQDKVYSKQRRIFLEANPMCKMHIPGLCTNQATTVQHLKGRIGDLYLDEKFWMAACWPCHSYVDTHPEFAFENGFALRRIT